MEFCNTKNAAGRRVIRSGFQKIHFVHTLESMH